MSASYSKDRAVGIGIWQAPPNLSKEAFENKVTTMVDKLVALPIAQKNYIKFEMMFQTGLVTEELGAHGVSDGPLSVWLVTECATIAEYLEVSEDPAVTSVFQEGLNSIYGSSRPTVKASLGEVQMRVDRPTAGNRTRLACRLQQADNFSVDGYHKTVNASADRLVGLPIVQKNVIKHSMWVPHNAMDHLVSAFDVVVPDPNPIVMIETENQDSMIEILKDSDVKQFMDDSRREWDIHVNTSFFVANVVTKIDN
ncbi:hypothetical protein C8R45DRAFT_1219822 [Mycena sanguinolenta]|nr:hypothetical protein C8R45DRAFT_1219822 [Mycena sanguinolenta]